MGAIKSKFWIFLAGFMNCLLVVMLLAARGGFDMTAEMPQVLSYHGTLTDHNGVPLQGTKTMTFRLYDTAEGGAPLWEETRGVSLQDGRFQVLLGTVVPFPGNLWANAPLYLGVQMAGSDELLPRQLVASVVHALTAQDTNTLSGRAPTSFADTQHTHAGGDITSTVTEAVNATRLDGKRSSDFAESGHTHAQYSVNGHQHAGSDITSAVPHADTVDDLHASKTPIANALLALDANGYFPTSVVGISKFVANAYTGNGQPERTISVGFTPDFVLVFPEVLSPGSTGGGSVHIAVGSGYTTDTGERIVVNPGMFEYGGPWVTDTYSFGGIVPGGFVVKPWGLNSTINRTYTNTSGVTYYYIAAKQ